jgi:thioredoxin reductase
MDSWLRHMPKGMMLKSDGFASDIYDPDHEFPLKRFCAEQGIEYADEGIPVRLETFGAYGQAFQQRMVPELEDQVVIDLDRAPEGFRLQLENGETVFAQRVVLAVGITHFEYVPACLSHLPSEYLSHSYRHHDLEPLRGRKVVVVGGGASALDLAGLLRDGGTDVTLVARAQTLKFHNAPTGKPRSWWQRIRHPKSGLGPGMRSRFFANAPGVFHYLPERLRLLVVRRTLGPSGGYFIKDKVVGRVTCRLGCDIKRADVQNGKVVLQLRADDGAEHEVQADQIIAATGYKVDIERLKFLRPGIRAGLKAVQGTPVLSSTFESSIPGLYFVGVAAANSFGPVMRFAFGAGFAAQAVARALARSAPPRGAVEETPAVVSATP